MRNVGDLVTANTKIYGDKPDEIIEPGQSGVIISTDCINSESDSCYIILFETGICFDLVERDFYMLSFTDDNIYNSIKNISTESLIKQVKNKTIKLVKKTKKSLKK